MPITSVNSYPPTAAAFESHWSMVNGALAAPLVLPDGMVQADFAAKVDAMNVAFAAIAPAEAAQRSARANLRLKREGMARRLVQFGQAVRLYLHKTRFADAAPRAPSSSEGEQTFKEATQSVEARWNDINAATDLAPFTPPLVLPPDSSAQPPAASYSVDAFSSEALALMDAFTADRLAGDAATQKRRDRDALLPPIYEAMKTYREACLLLLPPDSPLRDTLPRLTPAPGTTPPALIVSGKWDAQVLMAHLTWPATTAPDAARLQVRGCVGAYKAADEEVVADLDAHNTDWQGDWGLTAPGSMVSFKAYVMTTTGNENGGRAVKIMRP